MATVYSIYVINKAGSLIYQYNNYESKSEVEKTFGHPLSVVLRDVDEKLVVAFGERDGIKVGHSLLAVNGQPVSGKYQITFIDNLNFFYDNVVLIFVYILSSSYDHLRIVLQHSGTLWHLQIFSLYEYAQIQIFNLAEIR